MECAACSVPRFASVRPGRVIALRPRNSGRKGFERGAGYRASPPSKVASRLLAGPLRHLAIASPYNARVHGLLRVASTIVRRPPSGRVQQFSALNIFGRCHDSIRTHSIIGRRQSRTDASRCRSGVAAFFDVIAERLAADGRVELRGFGAFSTRARSERLGRNPRTGESVDVQAKRVPYFKPGKEMRARLNV